MLKVLVYKDVLMYAMHRTEIPISLHVTISLLFFQLYTDAFYQSLRRTLAEAQLLTPEMAFSWRAFNFDCTTKNPLGLQLGLSRPGNLNLLS